MERDLIFARNIGLISAEEQKQLWGTCVLIAGIGGDGGLLAERLSRTGIGHLILADPEVFEPANINRQYGANRLTIGVNKATAVARELALINPQMKITVCTEGITPENVTALVQQAGLVIDEIEYTLPAISVLLHRTARQLGKHVFMGANIGWGTCVFCFSPEGKTFEEHFSYHEENGTINPMAYMAKKPSYITDDFAAPVLAGNLPMPAVASSVSLTAAILASEIIWFLTGKRKPLTVPQFISIDLFDLTFHHS